MSIFDIKQIKNKPNRSTFDMSQHNLFTARLGQLTPVMYRNLMPGDEVSLDLSSFTQTSPISTNAYARIKEHFETFFVPFRLLYDKANDVIMENSNLQTANTPKVVDNVLQKSLPHTNIAQLSTAYSLMKNATVKTDCVFQDRSFGTRRLLHYLGYGDIDKFTLSNPNWVVEDLSLMPLAVYQKIYADFYRFNQWENCNPYTYNFNYLGGSVSSNPCYLQSDKLLGMPQHGITDNKKIVYGQSLLDIRYVNYAKDYLFGILPSQIADVYINPGANNLGNITFLPGSGSSSSSTKLGLVGGVVSVLDTGANTATINGVVSSSNNRISVLSLRASYALQKWSEVQQFADNNYKDLVKAHFGVDVPDYTAHMAEYLGGTSSMIQINDVVNSNFASGGSEADRKAYANGVTNGHVNYRAKEHGIIMVLYHADPVLDYDASKVYDPQLFAVSTDDFPRSEFDSLGLEPVYNDVLHHFKTPKVIGYAPRYWSWKSVIDYYKGAFCGSMKNFVLYKNLDAQAFITSTAPLDYRWFKVNPTDADTIFVVQSEGSYDFDGDQFYVNSGQKCHVTRALSYQGMPY